MPDAELIEQRYVFGMPDFTTMPAAATNDWMSSAFSGFGVTLPTRDRETQSPLPLRSGIDHEGRPSKNPAPVTDAAGYEQLTIALTTSVTA